MKLPMFVIPLPRHVSHATPSQAKGIICEIHIKLDCFVVIATIASPTITPRNDKGEMKNLGFRI